MDINKYHFTNYHEFKHKFIYDFYHRDYSAVNKDTGEVTDAVYIDGVVNTGNHELILDATQFKARPEYLLTNFELPSDIDAAKQLYEMLFAGACLRRAIDQHPQRDPDEAWDQIERALNWLETTDFYTAPASSRFHESFEGGLCYHSLKVAKRAVELMHSDKFMDPYKIGSAVFCALVHDWCKIGLYESYMKNVKDETTGQWNQVKSYRYKGEAMINLGHGVSSMFLISKFFRLNLEEASAIRWHMGAYRTTNDEFNELQASNEKYMLLHLIQFADQLSLVKY